MVQFYMYIHTPCYWPLTLLHPGKCNILVTAKVHSYTLSQILMNVLRGLTIVLAMPHVPTQLAVLIVSVFLVLLEMEKLVKVRDCVHYITSIVYV